MQDDPFIAKVKLDYGLRLMKLCTGRLSDEVFGYLLSQLTNGERIKIHRHLKTAVRLSTQITERRRERVLEDIDDALGSISYDPESYASDLIRSVFGRCPGAYGTFVGRLEVELLSKSSRQNKRQSSPFLRRLEELSNVFTFGSRDKEILIYLYLRDVEKSLETLFDSLKMKHVMRSVSTYCRFFSMSRGELSECLSKNGILIGSGLVNRCDIDGELTISAHTVSYLAGLSSDDMLNQFLDPLEGEAHLSLNDFSISREGLDVMRGLMNTSSGVNILLHGDPGTGKTEFAKTLVRELGESGFLIHQTDSDGDENLTHRKSALAAAQGLLRNRKCVLIADECDPIINSRVGFFFFEREANKDSKCWINQYLERSSLKIIWICNRTSGIDDSTKRRFSYVQEFRKPTFKQRFKAWKLLANRHSADFLDAERIELLARKYTLSPGSVDLALRDVQRMGEGLSDHSKLTRLSKILDEQRTFLGNRSESLAPISTRYASEVVNSDIPLAAVTKAVEKFCQRSAEEPDALVIRNLNLLLMGPPGTGKTEFAKHLADQVGRELVVKRGSDLLSCYIGESEKNIAQAFASVHGQSSILFLDEADSLFINRETAVRSWETSQTNELLCQMENFAGILVCATNFHEHMDPAVLRRFAIKAKFDYLKPEGNLLLFQRVLQPHLRRPLSPQEEDRVSRIPRLTPGDFKVVYQKLVLLGLGSFEELVAALEDESRIRMALGRKVIQGLRT